MFKNKIFYAFFLVNVFCAASAVSEVIGEVSGDPVAVGNGTARTFVNFDYYGEPSELGVSFTATALMGLPEDQHMTTYELKLPILPAGVDVHPFRHVVMNWNPKGHEPEDVYGAPHFDFHFYLIPSAIQQAITCENADKAICMKPVLPEFIPHAYAPTPAGVPTMGWHWIDTLSGEWHGQPFTSTFIYGYYNGLMSFLEPMITREFFLSKKTLDAPIRQPLKFPYEGFYPASYAIRYDAVKDEYRVVLKELWMHY